MPLPSPAWVSMSATATSLFDANDGDTMSMRGYTVSWVTPTEVNVDVANPNGSESATSSGPMPVGRVERADQVGPAGRVDPAAPVGLAGPVGEGERAGPPTRGNRTSRRRRRAPKR